MNKKLHFVGIGGSGISGVASLAEKFGYSVTGCDLEESTAYGKNIVRGHDPSHLKDVDWVIVSPALLYQAKENSEIAEAKRLGKLMTWQEFLGKILLKDKKLICVAGTHGKSTTTAMAGKLLIDNGFDPIVVVGAYVPEWGGNSRFGKGEYAVVEADEFNNNFLNYDPFIEIINNIEFDHPDFFKNEKEVDESFAKFNDKLRAHGTLILNWNDTGIQRTLLKNADPSVIRSFQTTKKFNLKILGQHNQSNALMVYRLGLALHIPEKNIIRSIENFTGIGRRLELITDRGGIKVYDDYAHHPTAIAATLQALREKYPSARIWAIDEPHGFARTKALLSNYKNAFKDADKVLIGPIFRARDKDTFGMDASSIAKISGHSDILGFDSFEQIKEYIFRQIKPGDILLVMGAGKSYLWAREIANLLPVKFSDITTFRIGGAVKKYFEVKNIEAISQAIGFAKNNSLPVFIIGDGTDILVSDKDFSGVVIKFTGNNISFSDDGTVTAEAGANWDKLVELSVERGFQGIECLSGIPGTCGAAPIQNIGAYGQELAETLVSLDAYDIEQEKLITFSKSECKFGYRESIFKKKEYWQKYIICSVKLKLSKKTTGSVNYESLSKYISSKKPTISEVRAAVLKVRAEKLENPKLIGNAGSFFKNPIIDVSEKSRLETKFPDIKIFSFNDKFKISAAWLIEKAGWKGKTYKTAAVSHKHALILINPKGNAAAEDVFELSEKIIADVQNKFGIKLEREVQLINF